MIHAWHTSQYCLRCGMSRQDAVDNNAHCISDSTNVIAISHILSARNMRMLIAQVQGLTPVRPTYNPRETQ